MIVKVWLAVWRFFVRLFIMAGLPLLAWGLDDLAGFFANPVRAGFVILGGLLALALATLVYLTPSRPEPESPARPAHLHADLFELIFILSAYGDRRAVLVWEENLALRWAGLAIFALGVTVSIWANAVWVASLSKDPTQAHADSARLKGGPYRWISHPALLALLLYSLGAALIFRSWVGLVILVPLVGLVLRRAAPEPQPDRRSGS